MCFILCLIPATFWVVVGFFVLFTSGKADDSMRKFGRFLAIWVFIVALFFPVCGAYMTLSGNCPMEKMMDQTEVPGGG